MDPPDKDPDPDTLKFPGYPIRSRPSAGRTYMPFGVGSRLCLGAEFAKLQIQVVNEDIDYSTSEVYTHVSTWI
ncbi:hypothetical protein F2Q69_00027697 [Brassica cretica]|uniref:Cytochrome P450 n=1 Tax=Brassica cretica TaxID=69181 RepID=A0A8S9S3J5_BRACR|nr:hypothetical protein F2Q69_00027697 [Brassica cretica]